MATRNPAQVVASIETDVEASSSRPNDADLPVTPAVAQALPVPPSPPPTFRRRVPNAPAGVRRSRSLSTTRESPGAKRRRLEKEYFKDEFEDISRVLQELRDLKKRTPEPEDTWDDVLAAAVAAVKAESEFSEALCQRRWSRPRTKLEPGARDIETALRDAEWRFILTPGRLAKFATGIIPPGNAVKWNKLGNNVGAKKKMLFKMLGDMNEVIERVEGT
ncbi:hypothetical protein QQZ08_001326 [Neonectria magnoliae]|uniref:Uncharacterized protein n=1 Tax=Neonectria magnoliae TaxID=2732573 RepID=A0ABR1IFS7_9HYPO